MNTPPNPCRCCGKVPYIDDSALPVRVACEQLHCLNTDGVEGATAELAAARWNEQNPIRTQTCKEPSAVLFCTETLNHLEDSHRNQIGDEILRGLINLRVALAALSAKVDEIIKSDGKRGPEVAT